MAARPGFACGAPLQNTIRAYEQLNLPASVVSVCGGVRAMSLGEGVAIDAKRRVLASVGRWNWEVQVPGPEVPLTVTDGSD